MKEQGTFVATMLEEINRMWNNGDVSHVKELFVPDFVRHEPPHRVFEGPQALADHILGVRKQYPDMIVTIDETIFDGERMVVKWRFRGTEKGVYPGSEFSPSGNGVEFEGVDILHLDEGKIVKDHVYYDDLNVLQQLGRIPESLF
jgi:predicted ester cyclase